MIKRRPWTCVLANSLEKLKKKKKARERVEESEKRLNISAVSDFIKHSKTFPSKYKGAALFQQ